MLSLLVKPTITIRHTLDRNTLSNSMNTNFRNLRWVWISETGYHQLHMSWFFTTMSGLLAA